MASCMALKRSFDHDRDSSSNNNSPFESRTSSPSSKRRRRCFPMTIVSLDQPPPTTTTEPAETSAFPDIQPILTTGLINKNISSSSSP